MRISWEKRREIWKEIYDSLALEQKKQILTEILKSENDPEAKKCISFPPLFCFTEEWALQQLEEALDRELFSLEPQSYPERVLGNEVIEDLLVTIMRIGTLESVDCALDKFFYYKTLVEDVIEDHSYMGVYSFDKNHYSSDTEEDLDWFLRTILLETLENTIDKDAQKECVKFLKKIGADSSIPDKFENL